MVKAFVFGKFLPFHKGHEAMIQFAKQHCDFLSVLICYSDEETIDGTLRKEWIAGSVGEEKGIASDLFYYKEKELANSSVSSREISKVWAKKFKQLYPEHELLVSSEPYGEFVSEYMGIRHIAFDIPRIQFPVSASNISFDLFSHWNFLPTSVRKTYSIKVVIGGTESTGKSTLARRLSEYFHASLVTEAGRDLIPDSKEFVFDDLLHVAHTHARNIDLASGSSAPLVIIDTDIHTTISYSEFIFSKQLQVGEEIYASNQCSLYLYLDKEVPYVQDGTRLEQEQRDLLDLSHRSVLERAGVEIHELGGNWEERFEAAVEIIGRLLEKRKKIKTRKTS